jgi:hypothetical protein
MLSHSSGEPFISATERVVIYQYIKNLSMGKAVLWCYLIWYLVTIAHHFDPSPRLWMNSLGISGLIGIGLVLSVASQGGVKSVERWQLIRLFLMPFCVSSFAALTKNQGFVLMFSSNWSELLMALSCCAGFLGVVFSVKHAPWVLHRLRAR